MGRPFALPTAMSLPKRLFSAKNVWLMGLAISTQMASALPYGLHGKYQGYDPLSVQRGLSETESEMELTVGKDSISVSTAPDLAGRRWIYEYTGDWIDDSSNHIKQQNSLFTTCYGLRGPAGSRQVVCFHRFHLGEKRAEVTLHPSENLSATTGVFFMKRLQLLGPAYWDLKNSSKPEPKNAWEPYQYVVPAFDFKGADRIMASGDPAEKYILFKRIGSHLWARTPQEIDRLVGYLRAALHDPNETVQAMALNALIHDHPVVQSLPMVVEVLNNPSAFPYTTVQRAASAGLALLAQGRAVISARLTLMALYGTSDLDDIYKRTGGKVSAAARGSIETILRLPEQDNTWDAVDRTRLLTSMLEDKSGSAPYFRGIFAPEVEKYREAHQRFSHKLSWMTREQMEQSLNDAMKKEVMSAFMEIRDSEKRVRQWTDSDIKKLWLVLRKTAANKELDRSIRDTINMSPVMRPCEKGLMNH